MYAYHEGGCDVSCALVWLQLAIWCAVRPIPCQHCNICGVAGIEVEMFRRERMEVIERWRKDCVYLSNYMTLKWLHRYNPITAALASTLNRGWMQSSYNVENSLTTNDQNANIYQWSNFVTNHRFYYNQYIASLPHRTV